MSQNLRSLPLTNLSLLLLVVCFVFKLGLTLWLKNVKSSAVDPTTYSYIGTDHPETWLIDVPKVILASDSSHRYQMDTPDGAAEWESLTPGGDGLVYLGDGHLPYTLSMVHQLRSVNILRKSILEDRSNPETSMPSDLARHCLNYLKQMMLCRADSYVEAFQYENFAGAVDLFSMYECRDWGVVHEAIKENQEQFEQGRSGAKKSTIALF